MGVTGKTLIGVADGRNAVSIAELAQQGESCLVYCYSFSKKRIVIRKANCPQAAGNSVSLLKVALDDGTSLRLTPDHEVMLHDKTCCKAECLTPNSRLMPFHSFIKDEGRGKHYRNI